MAEIAERGGAWSDLIEGLKILRRGSTDPTSPFWCMHDVLHVCADPKHFTEDEILQLEEWGFHPSAEDGDFYSFRFGSA